MKKLTKTLFEQANIAFREKNFGKALEIYNLLLREEKFPHRSQVLFNRSILLRRLGLSNKSDTNSYECIVLEKPDNLEEYYFDLIVEGGFFDPSWYLAEYKEKHLVDGNPLAHYLQNGISLSLNPSPNFDTTYYINANPDVASSGMHPFLHYVCQGRKEDRQTLPPPPREYVSRYTVSEPEYVPRLPVDAAPVEKAVRVIAFYLPQFHSIPENDKWWGKGFTEWTNVAPAKPKFEGHYQPHVPDGYLGGYNLLDGKTQEKQIELAKQYGIEGFCFYLYWFGGHKLLERPVDNYLENKNLDFPYCICWANENWSRRWDGLETDLLMEQKYSAEDDLAFIANASKYLRDPRYIRINGRPLLLVYRPNLFPDMRATTMRWRDWCRNNGVGEIYLTYPQSFERVDPAQYGFDAACEFPPNNSAPPDITYKVQKTEEDFEGVVYDWRCLVDRSDEYKPSGYKLFRSATPSWDNTARKKDKGTVFLNSCPKLFKKWLTNAFVETLRSSDQTDEHIVFVNAWNEWAEGAHLEPDQKYGYAWLQAVRDAHEEVTKRDALHPEIFETRWNKLAMLFGDKTDQVRYHFLGDYEALLRQAKKKGITFSLKEQKPSYQIGNASYHLESRADMSRLARHVSSDGPFCFVVLQYNHSDLTIRCVESIKKLHTASQEVRIIVVDNKSEQPYVDALKRQYATDHQVTLLYSDRNLGFSGGNNIGYRYARDVLRAGFCAVINNDTEIVQVDFIARTLKLFADECFSLAGPDVLITDGRRENPWNDFVYSIEEFQTLKLLREAERSDFLAGRNASFKKIGSASPNAQRIRNPLLQGAALIVSPIFMEEHPAMLDERLFLYGEEFLLSAECLLNGHLTVYDSGIQVRHREGATTATLPSREKMLLGYDSAISSLELVLDRLERRRAATQGVVINPANVDLLCSLLRGPSKHILIDLFFCQPGYHGGGEYGKAVFKKLLEQYATEGGFELWGAIDPNLFIDPWVWDLCKALGVNLIEVHNYEDITSLVNMDLFHSFFAPAIVVYTGYEYMKKVGGHLPFTCNKTRVVGTLHDIRDFELAMDRKRILDTRKAIGCTRELAMSDSDIQREVDNYLELGEQLREMYRKIISDEHVDSIITISEYCENSILTNIGKPAKPMQLLMSPMKPRPEPSPFPADFPHDFSRMSFALLVHAAREEKNVASAVIAFDRIFDKAALSKQYSVPKVVLTGIGNLDQLGLSRIRNKDRFICLPEVPPAQFEFLLSKASLFVYPSFNEGLGYPPIEAMTYGTECAVSATTAIKGVCADAAHYFSPYDIGLIERCLNAIFFEKKSVRQNILKRHKSIINQQRGDLIRLSNLILEKKRY